MNTRYKIVRRFFRGGRRTVKSGPALAAAQAHCQHSETSSITCTKSAGKNRTCQRGPWFDGYEHM